MVNTLYQNVRKACSKWQYVVDLYKDNPLTMCSCSSRLYSTYVYNLSQVSDNSHTHIAPGWPVITLLAHFHKKTRHLKGTVIQSADCIPEKSVVFFFYIKPACTARGSSSPAALTSGKCHQTYKGGNVGFKKHHATSCISLRIIWTLATMSG